jgi:diaminohydroxyphosphoribosylaminopyrimidine deaminase/5-amino-6-(5-phosphoribosylamino)uracil reductase
LRAPELADARQPTRVVVDSSGRVDPAAAVFDDGAPTLVATTERAPEARVRAWEAAGAEAMVLEADRSGGVSPIALVAALGKRDVQGVLLEGGATLAWSFLREDAIDRIVQYIAPLVVAGAGAHGVVAGEGFAPIDTARGLSFRRVERVGPDLRVEADVHRDH